MKVKTKYRWLLSTLTLTAMLIGSTASSTASAANCGDSRFERPQRPGIIREIRQIDGEMEYWYEEYINAPAYSWEKDYAYKQLTKAKNEANSLLTSASDLYGIRTPRLHRVAKEFYQKYLNAPSYSVQKDVYYSVQSKFWLAFQDSAIFRAECRGFHFEDLIQQGNRFYKLYLDAPSYSKQKESYYAIHVATWKAFEAALDNSFQDEYRDFTQLEDLGLRFYSAYLNAPSYSKQKEIYYGVTRKAFDHAMTDLQQALPYMNPTDLFAWQREYSSLYLDAPSYSIQKDYYYKAKIAVQRAIEARD